MTKQCLKKFTKKDIQFFLDKEIKQNFVYRADFLFGEKVKEIKKKNFNLYELTIFSIPLYLFSIIEGMAGLYSGENKKIQCSQDDVGDFIQRYFSKYCKIFNDKNFCKIFFVSFRHSLAHGWSPSTSISLDFKNSKMFVRDKNGFYGLNFISFYRVFKSVLCDFEKEISVNKKLQDNFIKRYSYISKIVYSTAKKFTSELEHSFKNSLDK